MQTEFTEGFVGVRRHQPGDVQPLFTAIYESIKELSPWLPWCHADYAIEETTAYLSTRDAEWEKGAEYDFAIFDARDGTFVGGVGLNRINQRDKVANLGYWVRTGCARRGIASAAALLAAKFAFQELGFNRLEIIAAVGNSASRRVAEKIGAKQEGILRKRVMLHGMAHDAVLYSLVAEDLKP